LEVDDGIMKIQILSDIHLEFGVRDFDFSKADLLILAGDVNLGEKGLTWILEKVKAIPVLYVLGNHEYYKNSYPKLLNKLREHAKETNVHVLENESITFENITFHGATLWTDFELFGDARIAGFECQQKMNDYHLIRRDQSYSRLRSIDTHLMHNESLKWLDKSLTQSSTKINVVITHHAPSIKSINEEFQNDLISAGYASNLENFILKTKPDIWIHGHIHESLDYFIGQTRVICNAKGYPGATPRGFRRELMIEML
jgi:Icc-related predicted phosphoesterase